MIDFPTISPSSNFTVVDFTSNVPSLTETIKSLKSSSFPVWIFSPSPFKKYPMLLPATTSP